MKFLLFLAIAALISLSSSQIEKFTFEEEFKFPIKAVAVIHGETKDPVTNLPNKISGVVRFVQETKTSSVVISVDIKGLPQSNQVVKRGFHIHEFAISDASNNITAVCGSTGSHFNPTNETHGFMDAQIRHHGDLGNLVTDENGTIFENIVDERLSLFGKYSIIGRSVVLHENEDDGGMKDTPLSRAAGTSGARIACGVIGYDKTDVKSVQRSLYAIISGQAVGFEDATVDQNTTNNTYLAFEDLNPANNTNLYLGFEDISSENTDDSDIMRELEDFSKTLPQTREIFKMFYRILKNMMQQAQDIDSPLTKTLSQFQIPSLAEVRLSVIPRTSALVSDNSSTTLDPNVETINLTTA